MGRRSAAQTRDKNSIDRDQLREVCAKLEQEFDYVLMDCPAGIEQGFKNAVAAATEAIIVTTPEVSAIRDADRVIDDILAVQKCLGMAERHGKEVRIRRALMEA